MKAQANYSGIMNLIHHKIKPNENKSLKNHFTTQPLADYALDAFAKSKASREKLKKHKANSTPNRAFFVRNVRTPKENRLAVVHSMMACSGQSLRLADLPCVPVSHPTTRYRQTVRSSAIAFNQLTQGLSAMLYKFLLLGKHRLNLITINFIHHNTKMNENNSQSKFFTTEANLSYFNHILAKSKISREKLNNLELANSSTPSNACFFVRTFCTPKENALGVFLSMVGRNRQPLEVGCLPVKAVFHPVTFYRQTVESLAVTSKNLFTGVTAMKHRISSPVHLNINTIHSIGLEYEYFSSATEANLSYFNTALSNSAEPQNSNNISVAYSNTPINACFFMRSTNTPKERLKMACSSMVACYGKGFALCCVPLIAVSEPVTRYRPSLRTFAVTSKNLFSGVTAMKIFIFAAIRRTDLTNQIQKIRIFAESEKQARATLAREFILVLAGRINLKNLSQTHRTLSPFALTSTVAEVKNA